MKVFLYLTDKRSSRKTVLEVSVLFKWSVLGQNTDGALRMLQYNSFTLRIIWANTANFHTKRSLPGHWNLIFTANIIHFMYVVSKCMTAFVKLLRILILLTATKSTLETLSFLIIPMAQMQWRNSVGASTRETEIKICCKNNVYSI